MNKEELKSELSKLGISLTDTQLESLEKYANILIDYNKHTNITAITDKESIYLKHFYDSLTLTKIIDLTKDLSVLDVGSGGGFPGIVIKIVYPNLKLTLLDSNNKKIKFLTELKDKIHVDNLELINTRVESLRNERLNYYDVVTARAVTNMPVLTELAMPLVKENKYFIAMKGSNTEEVENSKNAISKMHGTIEEINTFLLSDETGMRNIIKVKKIKETILSELRPYEKIIKKPY